MNNNPPGTEMPDPPPHSGLYRFFPALAVRNYRLFLGGQAISLVGTWMQGPAMQWVVYNLTGSTQALGWVGFLGDLPMTALTIVGGVAADKYSRRRIVIVTQAWLMFVALGLGMLAVSGRLNVMWLYVFAALSGVARAFDVPARQAFIVEMAGREHLGNAIALNSAMFNTARIVGPSIGGIVLAAVGVAACFFINAGSFLAIIVALFAMRGLRYNPARSGNKGAKDLIDGLRYVWRHRGIANVLVLTGAFSLFGAFYRTLLPAFSTEVYMQGPTGFGLLMSALGVGALPAALFVATTKNMARQKTWLVAGIALVCVTNFGLAFISNYPTALVLVSLNGFGMASFLVSGNVLLQHLSDARYQGRTMAARAFVFGGMWPFGSWIAGFLPGALGLGGTVAAGSAAIVVAAAILAPKILKMDTSAPAGDTDAEAGVSA